MMSRGRFMSRLFALPLLRLDLRVGSTDLRIGLWLTVARQ